MTEDGLVRQTADKLEASARSARWFGLGLVALAALAVVVTCGVTLYVAVQVRDIAEAESARQQKQVEADAFADKLILCILEQFAEHRAASVRHSQQLARLHGEDYNDLTPDFNPDRLAQLCDPVIKALQNGEPVPVRDDPAQTRRDEKKDREPDKQPSTTTTT